MDSNIEKEPVNFRLIVYAFVVPLAVKMEREEVVKDARIHWYCNAREKKFSVRGWPNKASVQGGHTL